jgi:DNA ligase-1
MLLQQIVGVSDAVAATPARGAKVGLLADALRGLSPHEAAIVVSWLSGALPQRQIGVGWAALRELPPPAAAPRLTVTGVDAAFTAVGASSGAGSQVRRRDLLAELFTTATASEQDFLRRLLSGDLRQGALAGIMIDAVARATAVAATDVRRAAMLRGDLPAVARAAISGGEAALRVFTLHVGRPVTPMLAHTATTTDDALARLGGRAAVEWKLDGARIQVHRDGEKLAVFTRTLDDITSRLPEVVQVVRGLPVHTVVLDGEAIALRPDGRPYPFQVTAGRVGTRDATTGRLPVPLTPFFFDVLHADGVDQFDLPAHQRFQTLRRIVPEPYRVARLVAESPSAATEFLADALAHGHEGVVIKSLDAPYEAGRRGAGWLKVKPVHALDLVVLAVEWGSGRRRGWLSNIHLGARDPETGGFVMLGKTFKGMTDAMLVWQTERFRALATGPTDGWVVRLRPEQVVEIAFDGVQTSSRYPGGVTLRFARVLRYREDKRAEEADTIETVRALHSA